MLLLLPARKALAAYPETHPPFKCERVFIGERRRLSDCGVRAICDKYSDIIGVKLHPHLLRRTMALAAIDKAKADVAAMTWRLFGHVA